MNARPDALHRRAARSRKAHAVGAIGVAPVARVRADAEERAGHGAFDNPLWLITIAMAVSFGLFAVLIAAG
jgi:hypothetical protein